MIAKRANHPLERYVEDGYYLLTVSEVVGDTIVQNQRIIGKVDESFLAIVAENMDDEILKEGWPLLRCREWRIQPWTLQ